MNHEEFTRLFQTCLGELPAKDRDVIETYWCNWMMKPRLITDDAEIGRIMKVEKAMVLGYPGIDCFFRFLFRNYIVSHAPLSVQKTIIKHELAHCFIAGNSPTMSKPRIPLPEIPSTFDSVGVAWKRALAVHRRRLLDKMDEHLASSTNRRWQSDEQSAHQWCDDYLRQNRET